MTLETFFEKFDLFAGAPDAVESMRELVLNFAVTGRLSEQRDNDDSVSELVDALARAKARLGKNGRRGAKTSVSPETDCPISVPSHWAWVPLTDIGAMSGGMTPSKDKSVFWGGDVNWFSSKDIKTDELTDSELKVTREATEATGLQVYSPGCLVMVARSGILKRTFPVSILRVEGTVNQDLKVLSPFVGGLERYLQIMFRGMTEFILTALVKKGMTVQSLKYEEFEAQPFPLPPLAEQKRIVAKVDELMILCDRLETQQQERETKQATLVRASLARFAEAPTPANLQFLFHPSYSISPADLRRSILTLAVQGKLVPQDPNDKPADTPEWSRAAKSAVPNNGADAPFDLPATWKWVRLGQVSELINGDRSKNYPNKSEYVREGVAWINTGHIEPDGTLSIEWMHYITREKFDSLRSGKVRPGDLVYCLRGATLGKTAVITQFEEGAVASSLVIIRLSPLVDPRFAYRFLTSPLGRQQIFQFDNGSAQPNLSANSVKKYKFPLPPLAEQRRIVNRVDQLMALVDTLETQLASSRTTAANLLSAIIAEITNRN